MLNEILVITADAPFGELIRQSLEETGKYRVFVTDDADKARAHLLTTNCNTVFLDPEGESRAMLDLALDLKQARPNLRFVVIVQTGESAHLETLLPEDYLSKPFYLPDLLETVEKLFASPEDANTPSSQETSSGEGAPAWLADVTRAAQHLTRLTLQSAAQAALITRNEQLWAYAGQLSQSAAREVADVVARYWDKEEQSDLVRFVRLASTDAEHMLYATLLWPNLVLVMVFDAETPFSIIRSQANQLARSLANFPAEEENNEKNAPPANSIAEILFDVPSPNPSVERPAPPPGVDTRSLENDPAFLAETQASKRKDLFSSAKFSRESSPAVPVSTLKKEPLVAEAPALKTGLEDELAVTVKSRARKKDAGTDETSAAETRPHSITEVTGRVVLEPASPAVFNLQYACLLIPRFTHHHLTGDLSERLSKWVADICVAFGWRLESIAVRPDYLQWVVTVPPATSPGYLMRIMRQHTSERIFADFTALARENPSGDFWAPGYLIMGGSQPPPPQLIKNFISQTRQRQGISQQIRR